MRRPKGYRCADLFAGIGGIRMGFERAAGVDALETVFVSEFDSHAVQTYAANYATPTSLLAGADDLLMNANPTIYGDITKIDNDLMTLVPDVDICLAGFPCQAFSYAGKRRGLEDDYKGMARGTLFQDLIRFCEAKKPKVVFCENVKGLLNHDHGKTLKVIIGAFNQIGYEVFYQVLNSSYFDVPQSRERLYMVAIRQELVHSDFCFPQGSPTDKRIKDILESDPVSTKYYLSSQYLETLKKHRARHKSRQNGFGYMVRTGDELAGTISCGGMGRERNLIVDKNDHETGIFGLKKSPINEEDIRQMTPREWARLQGFPDSFVLPVSDTFLYKQLGNSVSIPVIQAIATEVFNYLDVVFGSRKIGELRRREILRLLDVGPMTNEELVDELNPFFWSTDSNQTRSALVSRYLQSLKQSGAIVAEGKTRSVIWRRN